MCGKKPSQIVTLRWKKIGLDVQAELKATGPPVFHSQMRQRLSYFTSVMRSVLG